MSRVNTLRPNKATALTRVQALIAGTQTHFPSASFTLGGKTYTTATLFQALQRLENAIAALNAAHASVSDAGTALNEVDAAIGPLVRDYRRHVLAAFSTGAQELADFGMQPPKDRKPLSTEERVVATAKLRATRRARGTTSKKQKLAVKGTVTGVEITPVTNRPNPPPAGPPASGPDTHGE